MLGCISPNMHDKGKFAFNEKYKDDCLFTIDDDIIYPDNYI